MYDITTEVLTPRFIEAIRREGFHKNELIKKSKE